MEKLIANLSNKVQEKTLQGRSYLVAPVSMLVEGVWPGSAGPVLYEEKDITASISAWNARPITIGHPEDDIGNKVSGCTPEMLDSRSIGMVLNTRYNKKTKKLQAEAWFDADRLSKVKGAEVVHSALLANTKLEVSTGLFVEALMANGNHNGKDYIAKATSFKPDHLAIILEGEGACSLKDGAGLLVNKSAKPTRPERLPVLIDNAKSLMNQVHEVREAVVEAYEMYNPEGNSTWAYIEDIYNDSVVFSLSTNGESEYFKQNYEIENESVKLIGEKVKVTRKVSYSVQNQKEKMETQETPAAPAAPVAEVKPVKLVCNSVAELLEHAAPSVKIQIDDAMAVVAKNREELISKIIANSKDTFTADELTSLPTAQLQKFASVIVPAVVSAAPAKAPVYAGEAFVGNQAAPKIEVSPLVPLSTF